MEGSDAEVEDELVDGAPEALAAAQGPPQKKAKLLPGERHLNGAQTKLTKLQAALDKKEEQIAATMSRGAKKPLNPREEETMLSWRSKADKLSDDVETARQEVEEAKKTMAAAVEASRRKEEDKAQKEEVARALSEPSAMKVVELWVSTKYQERLNNSSDTVHHVFEHIHADFIKAVRKGDLPSTDERGVAALRKKCVCVPQTQLPPMCMPHLVS
jgi:DNA repair exonuclease SbcCD ATPase subunit